MSAWRKVPSAAVSARALQDWFTTPLGAAVLAAERRLLMRQLDECFGYHLLQLSVDDSLTLFDGSRVQRCFRAGPVFRADGQPFIQCDYQSLPFDCDSLDVVIVHHSLEFCVSPHAVLRELHRVLVPHGRLLLMGFNPWSLLGARLRLAADFGRSVAWQRHSLTVPRLRDWLALLGFGCERVEYGFSQLPLHRTARQPAADEGPLWRDYWPLGGIYLLSARKEVAAGIPLKPRWTKGRPRLVALPVAKPTGRAAG
ncbi:MAG: class I SAM-dependent methyltransferase [Spongiibacteraceae bacterium]|jgi:SAM-dependent methyltransferase|nr:class I SAM-dependent methyltransferase [Spongiibacteraceae bacterium]